MSEKIPIPPGYEPVSIPGDGFVGRNCRDKRHLELKSRRTGQLQLIDKARILPPGLWDLFEFLNAAAEAEGRSFEDLAEDLRQQDPHVFASTALLSGQPLDDPDPRVIEAIHSITRGPMRPSTGASHAQRRLGRERRR